MGKLVFGGVLLLVAFFLLLARAGASGGKSSGLLRAFALFFGTLSLFFILGALVVLFMVYFEARVGDAKNKTYLIMASASTLVFSYEFFDEAVAGRLVRPALSALFLAVLVGGIGGSLVGAVVRRVSGRYKVKPRPGESDKDSEKSEEAEAS